MQVECSHPQPSERPTAIRRPWLWVVGFAIVFLLLRVPLIYRQSGGHDEELFALAGWTILEDGIPRIPYLPSRDPEKYFYKADTALLMLPPAGFYWQAVVVALIGPGYASAQLSSALMGILAVFLVWRLGLRFYASQTPALWAAGLYSLSRLCYLPAIRSRPDSMCAAVSLGALLAVVQWQTSGRRRWLAAAGGLAGLALLTHPFAIIVCVQIGVWALLGARGWRGKLLSAALATSCALLAFSAWLPLILTYPDVFQTQFFHNVLNRAGPGLLHRVFLPFESIAVQSRLFLEHSGACQTLLLAAGLAIATFADARRGNPGRRLALALAFSSVALLVIFQGTHDMKSYWCYPGALLFLCVGRSIEIASDSLPRAPAVRRRWIPGLCGILLLALMLPGSGIRALAVHLGHWNEVDYNKPRFAERLVGDLPEDATYAVDATYVVDFYLSGRKTTLIGCVEHGRYDYYVLTPASMHMKPDWAGPKLRSYGLPDNTFACYAEVYPGR